MFKKEDYGSWPTVEEDPTIVFAEPIPNHAAADVSLDDTAEDPEQQRMYSGEDVIFVESAEAVDVVVVVENANPADAFSTVEDLETQRLISDDVIDATLTIDSPSKGDRSLSVFSCCDSRVAVIWINGAFLTILVLVDVFPQSIDEVLLPIAMAFVVCGIYGSMFFKRWAVNVAVCYYVLFMVGVIVENVVNNKPYRALVRSCLFSGILYAHLNLSKLMMKGIMTPKNYPGIACRRMG